jgi:hypothetical protein
MEMFSLRGALLLSRAENSTSLIYDQTATATIQRGVCRRVVARMMLRLKDIAALMDDCHPRTAKRWWKKLNAECRRMGWPLVGPDVSGHGPHRWKPETAARLIKLWEDANKARGTTLAIIRAKAAGKFSDNDSQTFFNFHDSKISRAAAKRKVAV